MNLHLQSIILTLILFIPVSIVSADIQLYNNTNLLLRSVSDNCEMYPGDTVIKALASQEKALLKSPHDWLVVGTEYPHFIVITIEGIITYRVDPLILSTNQISKHIISIDKKGPKISLSLKQPQ